jgi:predicted N-acyltransferase
MKLDTKIINDIREVNAGQWNNVVKQSDAGSVFHRYEWLQAIQEGVGLKPKHIIVEKNGNPVGICSNFITQANAPDILIKHLNNFLPKKLISVDPGFGGPIAVGKKGPILDQVIKSISSINATGVISHEMRMLDTNVLGYSRYLQDRGYRSSLMHCRFVINLNNSWAKIKRDMAKERRKNIRRVEESEVAVKSEELSDHNLAKFYDKYKDTMKRVNATAYPISFFKLVRDYMDERVKIFTAILDGESIGSLFYALDKERSSLHYFFAGIEQQYLKHYPYEAVHAHAIQWGIRENYDTYDFGESSANLDDGAFNYKRKFGAEMIPILSWEKGISPVSWNAYRLSRNLYRRRTGVLLD